MPKFIDFKTTMGHLGNWPGAADPVRGKAVFDAVCALPPGATILEVGSYCGRMTAIIGAAAKNSQASKIYCVEEWNAHPPAVRSWFGKAVVLHQLADLIMPMEMNSIATVDGEPFADLLVLSFDSGSHSDAVRWERNLTPGGRTVAFTELPWPTLSPITLNHGAFVYEKQTIDVEMKA